MGRGMVRTGWVPQQLILGHPSVGCFLNHGGYGSLLEGLIHGCQLVLLPQRGDLQFFNSMVVSRDMGAGVEVRRRDGDGYFGREDLFEAVETVMGMLIFVITIRILMMWSPLSHSIYRRILGIPTGVSVCFSKVTVRGDCSLCGDFIGLLKMKSHMASIYISGSHSLEGQGDQGQGRGLGGTGWEFSPPLGRSPPSAATR